MALTFRDNNLAPLSYDEMDSNFRYFTGSFENSGSITAASFTSSGNISASGDIYSSNGFFNTNVSASDLLASNFIRTPQLRTEEIVSQGTSTVKINDNLNVVGQITASGNVSSSADVYGVTGSFLHLEGDGSQLTGVTSEWDGSRNGNAEITGSLTVTSDISSSGTLYGNSLNLEGANISYNSTDDILYFADGVKLGLGSGPAPAIPDIALSHNGSDGLIRNSNGNLTIESSTDNTVIRNLAIGGDIILQSDKSLGGQGGVVLISGSNADVRLDIRGNVTSSGNISASGDMYSSMFRGEQLFLNSGSSQYLNTPAAGDVALIAMSGSGAFSTTSAIAPNNLVLFSEYKTGDTGTVNEKAASSILLTVNHGAFNSNNAVAQIACVARTLGTNDTDLVFSTRQNSGGTVNERMRIRNDKTQITGSLDVSGALSKGSGTFKIAHPISTGSLYHSFIEGPKCDLIYRGTTTLTNGVTDVNIDSVSNMTEGTFVALTQDPQLFLQNTNGWEPLKGSISGNILSIECKSTSSVDNVSWMVVAERADDFIKNWNLTDENGHLIPEQ